MKQLMKQRKRESFHILFLSFFPFNPGNLLVTLTLERISQAHE